MEVCSSVHLEALEACEFGEGVGCSAVNSHGEDERPPAHVEGKGAPLRAEQAGYHWQPPHPKSPQYQPCMCAHTP